MRWDERGDARDFWLALAAAALALFTKSSAYPVAATLLLFALLRLRSTGWSRKSLEQCAAAVLVLSAAATLPGAIRRSPEPLGVCQKVLGHACGGRYVPPVADSPGRFLSFDAGDFLRRSDTLPDDPHRDYFPNRLLKSALFGVTPLGEELESARHRALGVLIRSLLLLMIAVCVASVPLLRGAAFQRYRVYVAATVLMFSFLVAFRLRFPNPFHEDFRHIFPALVPLCLGYVKLAERLGRVHPLLGRAGHAIGLSMALSSAVFFLRLP